MPIKTDWLFTALLSHSQNIESANNNMRLHLTGRFNEISSRDVEALTQKYPTWRKDMEDVFFKIQNLMDGPVSEMIVALETILGEREGVM
jgi:hypothetical protein